MINKKNILQTAQALVRQYDLPLKIKRVEEGREEVIIHFASEKRVKPRELAQELEVQLNLPIKLQRIKKEELEKIGGVDILGKYPCCAPFLRKCPFGGKHGCGYGFASTQHEEKKTPVGTKPQKPTETPKTEKKRRKMVRRVVIRKQK